MSQGVFRVRTLVFVASLVSVDAASAVFSRSNSHANELLFASPENQLSVLAAESNATGIWYFTEQLLKQRTILNLLSRGGSYLREAPKEDPSLETHEKTFLAHVSGVSAWLLLTIIVACVYRRSKPASIVDLEASKCQFDGNDFQHGLCTWYEEPEICAYSCCCSPIRWADTMASASVLSFVTGFILYLALLTLDLISGGVIIWVVLTICFTYFRQTLRGNLGMRSGGMSVMWDFGIWCFCVPCAIAQEARQVKEAPPQADLPKKVVGDV